MAVYKVPQDVEAEDKLVGPFGFRQFVYLGIAGGLGFVAYLLFGISPVLLAIPLPFIGFFVILALPLRKEQPMETYLLALLRFYMKSKQRLWNPDGTITYVEIVAPKAIEQVLSKDLKAEAATERLDYLARVMDSRGWSLKGDTQTSASLNAAVAAEAETVSDIMDDHAQLSQSFADKIAQTDQQRRSDVVNQMKQAAAQQSQPPADQPDPQAAGPVAADDTGVTAPHFNPYPNAMHQRVIKPLGDHATSAAVPQKPAAAKSPAQNAASAIPPTVSPDIIRLANNDDLSISAIAHEAHRLSGQVGEEVVIKLH